MTTATEPTCPLPPGVTVAEAARWPTAIDAARELNVTTKTLRRHYRAYVIGGIRRYNPADLFAVEVVLPTARTDGLRRGKKVRTSAASRKRLDQMYGATS